MTPAVRVWFSWTGMSRDTDVGCSEHKKDNFMLLRHWRELSIGLVFMTVAAEAFAGSTYSGRVKVHCNAEIGHCNVNILGRANNIPSCASNPQWYVFDVTSKVWQEQLAIAMVAQASRKDVSILGSGTCVLRPGIHEEITWITLEDN